jgi:hypothetical protein
MTKQPVGNHLSLAGEHQYPGIPEEEILQIVTRIESLLGPLQTLEDNFDATLKALHENMAECRQDQVREFVESLSSCAVKAQLRIRMHHVQAIRNRKRWDRNKETPLAECLLPPRLLSALQSAEPPVTTLAALAHWLSTDASRRVDLDEQDVHTLQVTLEHYGYVMTYSGGSL